MNRFQKILSVFSAAVILATSTGLTTFADSSSTVVETNDTWQSVKSQYLKEDGTPLYPSYEPILLDDDGNEVEPDFVPKNSVDYISSDALSSTYNLVTLGRIGPVRNQNPLGTCWAHGALASVESNMITKGYANKDIDYSEAHLAWFGAGPGPTDKNDPLYGESRVSSSTSAQTVYQNGGNWFDSVGALSRLSGAELESKVPYSIAKENQAPDESTRYDTYATLTDANVMDPQSDQIAIKNAVVQNGAVQVSYYHDDNYITYSNGRTSYFSKYTRTNHAVSIVGWDDNYSVNNFDSSCRPTKNGAWLIRNSWGDWFGDDGYFYISYEEPSLAKAVSYIAEKSGTIGNLYQYDGHIGIEDGYITGLRWMSNSTSANVFTAKASEKLDRVGFYTYNTDVPYTITVYTNVKDTPTSGTKAYTQSGTIRYAGYHTIKLNTPVQLTAGKKFAVAVSLAGGYYHAYDSYSPGTGLSYYANSTSLSSSTTWYDAYTQYSKSACIKAYTAKSTPVAVTGLKATAGNGQVTLTWNAVSGASKYSVYYYLNGKYTLVGTTTGTSAVAKNLTNGTKYGFIVLSCVNGTWSKTDTANLVYATPYAVVSPKFTVKAGDSQATINWTAVSGASKYSVYYYLNGKYTLVGTTTGTSAVARNLTNGTKYGFIVLSCVNGTWTKADTAKLVYATPYAVVSPKFTVKAGDKQATINWTAVSGASKYSVYYYLNGKYTLVGTTTGKSAVAKNLTNGTKYGFIVLSCVNGTWTKANTANLVYATPYAVVSPKFTVKAGDKQATINWTAVSGATKYSVYYYLNGKYTLVGTTTGKSAVAKNLTNGTKYGFIVLSCVNGTWTKANAANLVYATPTAG